MHMHTFIGYELGIGLFVCQENVVQKSYFMGKGAKGFQSGAIANPIIDVTERGPRPAPPPSRHLVDKMEDLFIYSREHSVQPLAFTLWRCMEIFFKKPAARFSV